MGPGGPHLVAPVVGVLQAAFRSPIGLSNLQQTLPVIYVLTILSIIGAAITWGVLAYALWKFRDPATKGRKYG